MITPDTKPARQIARDQIAAVLLAAGTSSRYGAAAGLPGVNKLLLPFDGAPVVRRCAQTLLDAGVDRLLVVTGHERAQIEAALSGLPLTCVYNPDYATGEMLSSVKTGLTRLLPDAAVQSALIALGDMPLLPAAIVRRLMQAWRLGCGEILAPRHEGMRGHPVLIARRLWPAALALPPAAQMRALLAAHPEALALLQVNTDAVLRDVDTPELYQAVLRG